MSSTYQKQPQKLFYKKGASKKFLKVHRKVPTLESFFFNFIKKETPTQVFSCEFCQILRTPVFRTHPDDYF